MDCKFALKEHDRLCSIPRHPVLQGSTGGDGLGHMVDPEENPTMHRGPVYAAVGTTAETVFPLEGDDGEPPHHLPGLQRRGWASASYDSLPSAAALDDGLDPQRSASLEKCANPPCSLLFRVYTRFSPVHDLLPLAATLHDVLDKQRSGSLDKCACAQHV